MIYSFDLIIQIKPANTDEWVYITFESHKGSKYENLQRLEIVINSPPNQIVLLRELVLEVCLCKSFFIRIIFHYRINK